MDEIIDLRISECQIQAQRYGKWLNILRFPNFFLVGIGSLLAFVGGAAIVVNKLENFAGYMALSGGALTGLHGWLGCEAHQQKCRTIEARYSATKLKYETFRRATAHLMIDFGTPVTKIDSPRGESIMPRYALRPPRLRPKPSIVTAPTNGSMALRLFGKNFSLPRALLAHFGLANFPSPTADYQPIRG